MTPIEKAMAELKAKSLRRIQAETAVTWAARACAASMLGLKADSIEYAHEAIEHAALSGDDSLLSSVRGDLARHGVPV